MSNTNLTLSEATIFADFNAENNLEENNALTEITLSRLKYKHFREVAKYPEQDQMHHLMLSLTRLSEDDLGELLPDDAAEISKIIFEAMQKYIQLGQNIVGTMNA